jgi:hypothetical protein
MAWNKLWSMQQIVSDDENGNVQTVLPVNPLPPLRIFLPEKVKLEECHMEALIWMIEQTDELLATGAED